MVRVTALAGVVLMALSLPAAMSATTASTTLPTDAQLGLRLDGNLESPYSSHFGAIEYTRDQGGTFSGQISVVETQEAYWVGFVQAFNAKSNNYCADKNTQPGCYQRFQDLVGSDFIGFSWTGLPVGGAPVARACVAVGTLYATSSGYASGPADNDGSKDCAANTAGLHIQGFANGSADGKSALDYNINVLKWTDFDNSPNFAGQPAHPYIYPSIAEVRIDKAKAGMADGLASTLANATVLVHNSPAAPLTGPKQLISMSCTGSGTINVGQTATFPVQVSLDGVPPTSPQQVIATAVGPGEVVSVGGQAGNIGPTGSGGVANVVVRGTAAGTVTVGAAWDLNGNGIHDVATEPVTPTTCPLTVVAVNPTLQFTLDKTNDANGDTTYSKSEMAASQGATVPFRVVVTNTSTVSERIDSMTDAWPGQAAFTPGGTCGPLVGTKVLAPGESVTCGFSLPGYAPAPGTSLVDTVSVQVSLSTDPAITLTKSSTSEVATPAPSQITITVNKTNDADGSGTYTKSEVAPTPGAPVPFDVELRNTSTVPVRVDSITDEWPGQAPFTPTQPVAGRATCTSLLGTTLAAGQTATCAFLQSGYAPAAGVSLTDTVTFKASELNNPGNQATATSTSVVTTAVVVPPVISMTVDKTNDANADGTFTKSETAPKEGASVPFKVVVTNTSPVAVDLTALTDEWPGRSAFTPAGTCGPLVGSTTLAPAGQPGASVTCSFTQSSYAPVAQSTLIDTVVARVVEHGNPGNGASASSTSAVSTAITPPPPPVISMTVDKTNDGNIDGTFTKSEIAPLAGNPVTFRAVVTNTSAVAVLLSELTDTIPGTAPINICTNLIGHTLLPGGSLSCDFSRPAPPAGTSVTDTVQATVTEVGDPSNKATATSQSTVRTAPVITATIVKTNDGNGDGVYTDSETVPTTGAAVPYRAVITNTSAVPIVLTALTDVFPGGTPTGVCASLLNTVLPPGGSVTCDFTAPAPAAGPAVTDTVKADLVELGNPTNDVTVQDVSTVQTVEVLGVVVVSPAAAAALPFTGSDTGGFLSVGFLLLGTGLMMLGFSIYEVVPATRPARRRDERRSSGRR